ncbi:MAG TPA: glycosyl hydrolase family 65 protein, partial [Rugosimonospora sp.]|nr:glycosyl hydrolase family 65 protein [Rugosimonospora sp.]
SSRIQRLDFSVLWRGLRLRVDVGPEEVTYSLRNGHDHARVDLLHYGEKVTVTAQRPVTVAVPPAAVPTPQPEQPKGRRPVRRPPQPTG